MMIYKRRLVAKSLVVMNSSFLKLIGYFGVDSGGCMKLVSGLSFLWKRALGITALKRKISKVLGIPLTRSGRRAKLGRWLGMK